MKKILTLFLAICMICTLLPFGAFADSSSNSCGANATWKITGDKLTISGDGAMSDFNSTGTEAPWKRFAPFIRTVEIENGITSIGSYAFALCDEMTGITIPETVTKIGDYAFNGCSNLKNVKLPSKLESIGSWAFNGCKSLTNITIPGKVTSIGDRAFFDCSGMTEFFVSSTNRVFETKNGCLINKREEAIVVYPANREGSCSIPESIKIINAYAFNGCSKLTEVRMLSGVERIGVFAFYDCDMLKNISLPESVTNIGEQAFSNCDNLTSIDVSAGSYDFTSENGVLFNKDKTELICCPGGKSGNYTIPDSVKAIDRYAFAWCGKLTGVAIPNGVIRICANSFYNCSAMTVVYVPSSVADIDASAFEGCNTLKDVFYHGDEAQWKAIALETAGNDSLTKATFHYDSHDYVGKKTKEANCTEAGETTYTCTACGITKLEAIPALGHEYKDGKCVRCGAKEPIPNPFVDVKNDAVYYDAVLWAVENGITKGTDATHFAPDKACTRGQVVTLLWRAAGSPEPKSTKNPFVDVQNSGGCAPYYKAILWAAEEGITTGVDKTHFKPNDTVTRAQFVTFLYRYEKSPETKGSTDGFKDAANIAKPFRTAVAWAVENGITTGYNDGTFRPNDTCTRWAVVLFMQRDLAK